MDHAFAVGVLNGGAGGAEQLEALRDAEFRGVAIDIDALAFDEVHSQPGNAVCGRADVEKSRDVGMIEGGEDFAFLLEAAHHLFIGREHGTDHLQRDTLACFPDPALGKKYCRHAT